MRHVARIAGWLLAAQAVLLAGCASRQAVSDAIEAVNREFRAEYESTLAERGTRTVPAAAGPAYAAMRAALARLGMSMESEDPGLGYLAAVAPAPRPLDEAEWTRTTDADLPRLREIARPHIGALSTFIRFEPEGLLVLVNATIIESGGRSDVSLTMRMRETAPPRSGVPRREYPPPAAVRLGLDKIWAGFERELAAGRTPR